MRNRLTQPRDTPASFIGDSGFVGVNSRLEPHALPPGYVSDAVNCRFRNGVVETRKGFVKLPWLNKISTTTITISSITRAGSVATATTASNHGLGSESVVTISGATQPEYNGSFVILGITSATVFSYEVTGTPATPATGSPVLKKHNQQPWGTVYGVGQFSDPATGKDYMLIAADGNVYASVDNQSPFTLSLPAGVTVTAPCTFKQAFDTVVLFRGADATPLAMTSVVAGFASIAQTPTTITRSGTTATVTTSQDHGFFSGDSVLITGADQSAYNGTQTVTVTGSTTFTYTVSGSPATPATGDIRVNDDGTEPIPNAERGLYVNNRLIIPNDSDELAVSDINSYTKYLPFNEFRINVGSADALISVEKFNDTTVICFKGHSIYALNNFYGDLAAIQLDQITDRFGLVAAESVAHCGSDLLFLSQMGVMSIRQTEQNKLQGVTLPLSDPIQPLIDRINWKYASGAQATYWDSRYYLAVPFDDAEISGPELVSGQYPPGLPSLVRVTVNNLVTGATYRWVKGANEVSLVNGSQTLTVSNSFTAQGTSVIINGTAYSATVTASLKRVHVGVNNAILVYDFLNQAWSGYDEASGFSVKKFHVRKYQGLDRLFAVTHEGWVVLYEEDFQDQVMVPYVDLVVSSAPSAGNVVNVNGGTTVSALAITSNVAPTTWGVGSPPSITTAGTNLWADSIPNAGYSTLAGANQWSAPNTIPVKITNGVSFYSTNGVMPTVFYTGTWPTVTEHAIQQINSRLTTRGYAPDGGESLSDFDWLCLDIQTWFPDYSLELLMDGPYETKTISSSITKSRSRYTIFGRAAYDTTNANHDHGTDHREDYSVDAATPGFDLGSSSADVMRHQEFREQFKVRSRGRSTRVKINSAQGRFRLMACKIENRKVQTKAGART